MIYIGPKDTVDCVEYKGKEKHNLLTISYCPWSNASQNSFLSNPLHLLPQHTLHHWVRAEVRQCKDSHHLPAGDLPLPHLEAVLVAWHWVWLLAIHTASQAGVRHLVLGRHQGVGPCHATTWYCLQKLQFIITLPHILLYLSLTTLPCLLATCLAEKKDNAEHQPRILTSHL